MEEVAMMIDNRKVSDNHQKGIERKKQHSGNMEKGHGGKMGTTKGSESNFKRSNNATTPRRA